MAELYRNLAICRRQSERPGDRVRRPLTRAAGSAKRDTTWSTTPIASPRPTTRFSGRPAGRLASSCSLLGGADGRHGRAPITWAATISYGRGHRSLRVVRPIGPRLRPVRSRTQRMLDGRQRVRREHGRGAVAMVRVGDQRQCALRLRDRADLGAGRHARITSIKRTRPTRTPTAPDAAWRSSPG